MSKKTLEINPFRTGLRIKMLWKMTSRTPGEETPEQVVHTLIEADRKTSVYHEGIFEISKQLSGNARLVLIYMMSRLQYNAERIELKQEKLSELCEFGRSTFYKCIEELATASVIVKYPPRKDMYWVNPKIMFNGRRHDVFKDCREIPPLPKSAPQESVVQEEPAVYGP